MSDPVLDLYWCSAAVDRLFARIKSLETELAECKASHESLLDFENSVALVVGLTIEAPTSEIMDRVIGLRRERDELKWMREDLEK